MPLLNARDSVKLLKDSRKALSRRPRTPAFKESIKAADNPTNATDEVKWQVKSLPTNWEPNTTPSSVVENLITRKEAEHDKCLAKMTNERVKVNIDVEREIRLKSEMLKQKMEENLLEIKEAMKLIDLPDDMNSITIEKQMFDRIMEIIDEAILTTTNGISEHYETLLELEKCRSESYKGILKNAYGEMSDVSYKLPKQLQEFFEMEILNINQITLSNFRAYEELKMNMMLKAENDRRLWTQSLLDKKDEYISLKKAALSQINPIKACETDEVFCLESWNRMIVTITDKHGNVVDACYLKKLAQSLAIFLINYNVDIKVMDTLINDAINKIYTSKYDELAIINSDVAQIQSDYLLIDLVEEIRSSFYDKNGRINSYTLDMMEKWEDFQQSSLDELLHNTKIFTSAAHLWDEHFRRIFDLQELTLLEWKMLMDKLANSQSSLMCKRNVLIDTLRQASTEDELKKTMIDIKKCMQSFKKMESSNKAKEEDFFKKYRNLSQNETVIFLSEVVAFVGRYVKNEDVDPTVKTPRASRLEIAPEVENETPSIMLGFNKMAKSLKNYIFGLQDRIESSVDKFYSDLSKNTESWIKYQCMKLTNKYDLRNTLKAPNFQRIYEYIYKVRLAELKQHAECLEKHKLAVKEEMKTLKDVGIRKEEDFEKAINEYVGLLPDYEKMAERVEHAVNVEQLILQFTRLKQIYAKKLQEVNESFTVDIGNKLNEINSINLEYLKCLKLFSERGNYSVSEVKKFKGVFNKLAKAMKKEVKPYIKRLKGKFLKETYFLDVQEKPIMDKLIKQRDELKFVEDTNREISQIQNRIKEITYETKYKMILIERVFGELKQRADLNSGAVSYLNEFSENCEYLRAVFKDAKDLLMQPYPFKLKPELFVDNTNWSKVSVLKSRLDEELGGTDNFNMVLFEKSPEKESVDYIGKIVDALYNSLNELQTMGKTFYGTYNNFSRKGILPDLKTYMLEYLSRFIYYELQCEEFWLNTAIEYIINVESVLQFMRSYYVDCLKSYVDCEITEFKDLCQNYTTNVKSKHTEVDQSFRKLHNKLKPLHGHPKNSALLELLEAEREALNERAQEVQVEISEEFETIKEEIKTNLEHFEEMLWIKETALKSNLDGYISLILDENALLQLIKNKIEYFNTIISSDYYNDDNTEDYSYIIVELNQKLNEFKKGIRLSSESLLTFTDHISKVGKTAKNMSYISYQQMQSVSSGTIQYSHVNIMDFMQVYEDQQEMCLKKLQYTKDVNLLSSKWNEQWENDLKRIKKLYTVKYDQNQENIMDQ